MAKNDRPQGPYTCWRDNGGDGWVWSDHASLDEALEALEEARSMCASLFVVMKPVKYRVVEDPDG